MSAGLAAMMNATLRVLIVEDDARYRAMLVTMLRDLQCEPAPVASAFEAHQWLAAHRTDLVLLDLNMPRMDGLTFLTQWRQRDPDTPVIILTGVGTLPAAQAAIRLGVIEFLTKPCHLGVMEAALDRVRRLLGTRARPAMDDSEPSPEQPPPPQSNADAAKPTAPIPLSDAELAGPTLADLERQAILTALARHGGNRSAAAQSLGISRRTMHYRIAEYRDAGLLPPALDLSNDADRGGD